MRRIRFHLTHLQLTFGVSQHAWDTMLRRIILVLLATSAFKGSAAAQTDPAIARVVLEREDQRFAAMVRADTGALRGLLSDDLSYTHTSGRQDTKSELLRSLASAALRYESITPEGRGVRFEGGLALVVGRSTMRAGAPGSIQTFVIRYLAVYTKRDGSWRLLAWQATRLPP